MSAVNSASVANIADNQAGENLTPDDAVQLGEEALVYRLQSLMSENHKCCPMLRKVEIR